MELINKGKQRTQNSLSQSLKSNLRIENFFIPICPEENISPTLCAHDHDIEYSLSIAQQEYSSEFSGEFEIEHDDTIANFSSENEVSTISDDPSTWSHVTEVMRSYWAKEGRDICQHFDENFMASLHKCISLKITIDQKQNEIVYAPGSIKYAHFNEY